MHHIGALPLCHVAMLLPYHTVVPVQHIGYVPIDSKAMHHCGALAMSVVCTQHIGYVPIDCCADTTHRVCTY